jgi:hypothetical protein
MNATPTDVRPPPEFLQPGQGGGAPSLEVYLSWGGAVYGPTGTEEVLAGLRKERFEEEAHFWFEGLEQWLPMAEFEALVLEAPYGPASRPLDQAPAHAPSRSPRTESAQRVYRERRGKSPRRGKGKRGWWIILGIILLAAVLTIGVILLLMEVL